MKIDWYIGCVTDEEKEERAALFQHSSQILRVLKSIVQRDLLLSQNKVLAEAAYELAAWPMRQADLIGEQRTLKRINDLLPEESK
jgi:hypothetical protein